MSKRGLKVNGGIKAETVRLIDEENNQVGVVSRNEAMSRAREAGLDLVEVAPTSEPPVCRIMDYGKWQYQQKRKIREAHKRHQHHTTTLKEIRLRPETDKHDLDIKLNHAREFLEKGHKVQFTMFFRGRQMLHRDQGYEIYENITELLQDVAKIERPSKMSGRRMTLLLVPK
ncbi:MAG: translation initiation factor IF-3 [Phycisphaerae bacterium]|nr:translation initiation factor IF-3 [Phycisphaerae bacterium]NIP53003.1 translation initiation factor IF-3 [Phycisphaerae bacterium]NIS52083.1 translation initiation factor IF-3 [Phycisphaerae bacterium]NIU09622.1 translation initiation factor IF-3 [Phycisphaerae bacterium]NIU57285.1 translation initiation factor IF-3 [Phycisphaerae bacterium]